MRIFCKGASGYIGGSNAVAHGRRRPWSFRACLGSASPGTKNLLRGK